MSWQTLKLNSYFDFHWQNNTSCRIQPRIKGLELEGTDWQISKQGISIKLIQSSKMFEIFNFNLELLKVALHKCTRSNFLSCVKCCGQIIHFTFYRLCWTRDAATVSAGCRPLTACDISASSAVCSAVTCVIIIIIIHTLLQKHQPSCRSCRKFGEMLHLFLLGVLP